MGSVGGDGTPECGHMPETAAQQLESDAHAVVRGTLLSARPEGYPRPNSGAALPVAPRVEGDEPSDSHKGPAPRVESRARPVLLGSKTCVGNSAAVGVPEWGRRW